MNVSLRDILDEIVEDSINDERQRMLTESDESDVPTTDSGVSLNKDQKIAANVAAKTAAETAKKMNGEGDESEEELDPVSCSVPLALAAGSGALSLRKQIRAANRD